MEETAIIKDMKTIEFSTDTSGFSITAHIFLLLLVAVNQRNLKSRNGKIQSALFFSVFDRAGE
jgi:hypothetical protein